MSSISSRELTEWMALEQIEGPLYGARREDLRAGVIAATVANVFRGKGDKPLSPEDFVMRFEDVQERAEKEAEQQVSMLRRAAKPKGGS